MSVSILIGDCRERMKELPDASVDSCVCDPPYHLTSIVKRFGSKSAAPAKVGKTGAYARASRGFMGQTWDGGDVAFQPETWAEVLRVLKPGGHLVAFSGTRTYHRMAVAIEDAGFEVRDQLAWVYGSGFPKSLDVSKQIDKAAGAEREVVGPGRWNHVKGDNDKQSDCLIRPGGKHEETAPATEAAKQWQGWGTALKPSWEPICLARKPLDGTVAGNVLKHGTGAINIDGCRIDGQAQPFGNGTGKHSNSFGGGTPASHERGEWTPIDGQGRWPANIIHDGSDEVLAGFPETEGAGNIGGTRRGALGYHGGASGSEMPAAYDAGGSAARFFQQCEWGEEDGYGLPEVQQNNAPADVSCGRGNLRGEDARRFKYCPKATTEERGEGNNHPTVKPVALMRWLVRLVTPPGGTVLDPFMGSGSTGIAADAEQFDFIGCEMSSEYAAIAERRIRDAAGMFAEVKAA